MTSKQPYVAVGTAFLLVLTSACGTDSMGPDEAGFDSDRVALSIGHIEVIHDCDPAWDNPGDFQGFVEIYHVNSGHDLLLAASPRRTILLNSGESASGDHIRTEALVPRDQTRPVRLRGVFHELDNGVADAGAELVETVSWSDERNCWQLAGQCMGAIGSTEYYRTWTMEVHTRDDVWNPFNSDDEGCWFKVTFVAEISDS